MLSHAEVLLSEIAWMGTEDDVNDEWIELYNFSSEPTDLAGWTLTDGDALNIALSGVMPPHGVFVLERTDDSTLPSITADIIYTGALANTGATLTIHDAEGGTIDQVIGGESWQNIGGDNELKYTAQRTRTGSWVTAEPTPGAPNAEENAELPDEDDTTVDTPPDPKPKKTTSGGSTSKRSRDAVKEEEPFLILNIEAPRTAYVNQEVKFVGEPSGVGKTIMNSLKYMWNFGDIETGTGKEPTHVFQYPGEYIVVSEAAFAKQKAQARHTITILPTSFTLTTTDKGDVVLSNKASHEVNLEGFTIRGTRTFTFPRLSILRAGGSITIPKDKIGSTPTVALYDTQKTLVAATQPVVNPSVPRITYTTQPASVKPAAETKSESTEEFGKETALKGPQVITIGNAEKDSDPGFFARVFQKIGSFFRL